MCSKFLIAICSTGFLASWLLFSGTGCTVYGGSFPNCDGVTCSDHGQCEVVSGGPACQCDPGWRTDPGDDLVCVVQESDSVIVDLVTALGPSEEGFMEVSLRDHEAVWLDEAHLHASVHHSRVEMSMEYRTAIYIEIDPASRVMVELRVPFDSPVHSLIDDGDGVVVQLIYSAAIHYLKHDHPDFDQMYAELETALGDGTHRLVTETRDAHEIIDVRLPLAP